MSGTVCRAAITSDYGKNVSTAPPPATARPKGGATVTSACGLNASTAPPPATAKPQESQATEASVEEGPYERAVAYAREHPFGSAVHVLGTVLIHVLPLLACCHLVATEGWPPLVYVPLSFFTMAIYIGLCMSIGLHRYFSHAAFQTSRAGQLALWMVACLAYQNGPLWWASKHRRHHKYCDTPQDPHSWTQTSFLYAWIGWAFSPAEKEIEYEYIQKLATYPELVLLENWPLPFVPCIAVRVACFMAAFQPAMPTCHAGHNHP